MLMLRVGVRVGEGGGRWGWVGLGWLHSVVFFREGSTTCLLKCVAVWDGIGWAR